MNAWVIQKAVYEALAASAPLMAMITGIFDDVAAGQAFPYLTFASSTHTSDDLLIENGANSTLTLNVWDRSPGFKTTKQIMDRVDAVLHRRALVIEGTQAVSCVLEFSETMRDVDAETRRGVMRFRIVTFQ